MISLWTDIDFWETFYNQPGIDTNYQTGYCWSKDEEIGENAAVGYILLYGPAVRLYGDTAILRAGKS